jgi:hypothetical protein
MQNKQVNLLSRPLQASSCIAKAVVFDRPCCLDIGYWFAPPVLIL